MTKRILKLLLLLLIVLSLNVGQTGAYFASQASSTTNVFSTGCWLAPAVPTLLYPTDGTSAGLGSAWDTNPYLDWADSQSTCPTVTSLSYQYEVYQDALLTQIIYRSGWLSESQIPAPGTPDGTYYWRVRAKDNLDQISNFSSAWKLVVDRSAPKSELSIEGSYLKKIEEKITNGGFEDSANGWRTVGDTQIITNDVIADTASPSAGNVSSFGSAMARLGQSSYTDDSGNYVWENRLMQSFQSGAKSLSFSYNLYTRDFSDTDSPAFFVRLNGQESLTVNSSEANPTNNTDGLARSTGWQERFLDLSSFETGNINLAFHSGNNLDRTIQSWTYIDRVSTYFVAAPAHAKYYLSCTDTATSAHCEYKTYNEGEAIPSTWTVYTDYFQLPGNGTHYVIYRAVDEAGNVSSTKGVKIITDANPPSETSSLDAVSVEENNVSLTWLAPGNDGTSGQASKYDLRYQKDCNTEADFNFDSAIPVTDTPTPKSAGKDEYYIIYGLNPETAYCFGLKTADEAPNWTTVSNIVQVETPASLTTHNYGDVVVNELMWTDSTASGNFIELRNLTDHEINLTGWQLLDINEGPPVALIDFDLFTDPKIPAKGYLVVANTTGNSVLKTQTPYQTDTLILSKLNLSLRLDDASGVVIDQIWDGTQTNIPITDLTGIYYSMERTSVPEDGISPFSWYTCIDAPSTVEFFTGVSDYRGTPNAANRSENEPLARSYYQRVVTPTYYLSPTPTPDLSTLTPTIVEPQLDFVFNSSANTASFNLVGISAYDQLSYEITYLSDGIDKGISGKINNLNQESFSRANLLLGTCSGVEGKICVYDRNIMNLALTVKLTPEVGDPFIITKTLTE